MQGNYIVLDTQKFYDKSALFKGRKPAKLSTFSVFKKNAVAKQNSIKSNVEVKVTPTVAPKVEVQQPQAPAPLPQVPPKVEPKKVEVNNVISFPTKDILDKKATLLNATFYNDLPGKVVTMVTNRRLRVNSLIVSILNHVKKVAAVSNVIIVEVKDEPVKEQFDFSKFQNTPEPVTPLTTINEAPKEEIKATDNDQLLEKYLIQLFFVMTMSAMIQIYIISKKLMIFFIDMVLYNCME